MDPRDKLEFKRVTEVAFDVLARHWESNEAKIRPFDPALADLAHEVAVKLWAIHYHLQAKRT